MDLFTNDVDSPTTNDSIHDDSLPCSIQYAVKMLIASSACYSGTKFGVRYWRMSRTENLGLTSEGVVLVLNSESLQSARNQGGLQINTKRDTVVAGIGRLLKLCS